MRHGLAFVSLLLVLLGLELSTEAITLVVDRVVAGISRCRGVPKPVLGALLGET